MSRNIDERIVEMRFDNKQFESGVKTTMSTLDKLKSNLDFNKSTESMGKLQALLNKFSFGTMASGIESISAKFNALGAVAFSVIQNITNRITNLGLSMAKQITIQPIVDGFREYELKMGSIQTILANTERHGTKLNDVSEALNKLNEYADLTIYNFGDMTRNIGMFTNAGLELETSVSMIKGFSNAAAASGTNASGAAHAAYQLSQALSAGTVRLMDWRSLTNVGMGNKNMQLGLIEIAEAMGVFENNTMTAEQAAKDFNSSLETQWLSADVMSNYLQIMAGDMDDAAMASIGLSKAQIESFKQQQKTAEEAATKVRSFTQLVGTIKESLGSTWATTWDIILGDFDEATELFTSINNAVGGMLETMSESRNAKLLEWDELGGRKAIIDGLSNAFKALFDVIRPVGEAFRDIFPATTGKQLADASKKFLEFTKGMAVSSETADKLKRTFKGVFSIFSIGWEAIKGVASVFKDIVSAIFPMTGSLLDVTAALGDFITGIRDAIVEGGSLAGVFDGVGAVFSSVLGIFRNFADGIANLFTGDGGGIGSAFSTFFGWINDGLHGIADLISRIDLGAVLGGAGVAGVLAFLKKASGFLDKIVEAISGFLKDASGVSVVEQVKETLGGVTEALNSMTNTLNATTLLMIGGAIASLAIALRTISNIDEGKMTSSLTAIGALFLQMAGFMAIFNKAGLAGGIKGLFSASAAMVVLSTAVNNLSKAVKSLSSLSWGELIKGLTGTMSLLTGIAAATRLMKGQKGLISTSIGMLAVAGAIKVLASASKEMSSLPLNNLVKGLGGVAALLASIAAFTRVASLDKGGIRTAMALLAISGSIKIMASALKDISSIKGGDLAKSMAGIAGMLASVGIFTRINNPAGILKTSVSLILIGHALGNLGQVLADVGSLSWGEIGRGLTGIAGVLATIATITTLMGKAGKVSSISGSASILIVSKSLADIGKALKDVGKLRWGQIARGLSGIGGALALVAGVSGALGKIAPIGGLLGGGAILLAVQSLGDLATAMEKFGDMSWDEIGRGLVGMGGALGELALITGILGTVAPIAGLLGGGSILLGVQSLGDLADALKKFGDMGWDEIGRGLTAMGAALGTLAAGTFVSSIGILGSLSISMVAEPLGVLADSLERWSTVSIPENINTMLFKIATGISAFTFAFTGALSIKLLAQDLGTLADSMSKWKSVAVPENIASMLGGIASGVMAFTFAFGGALSIKLLASDLGVLANSVMTWSGVTLPSTLETDLKAIANGVQAFTWLFVAGWSLSTISGPLGELAGDISRWNGVAIPGGLEFGLKSIANGLESFTWLFMSGWSISALAGPLGSLSDAIRKWSGISVPTTIESDLKAIANGINAFPDVTMKHNTMQAITPKIRELGEAVATWSGKGEIANSLGGWMRSIWNGISAWPETQNQHATIASIHPQLTALASAMNGWTSITVPANFQSQMTNLNAGLSALSTTVDVSGSISNLNRLKSAINGLSFKSGEVSIQGFGASVQTLAANVSTYSARIQLSFVTMQLKLQASANALRKQVSDSLNGLIRDIQPLPSRLQTVLGRLSTTITNMGSTLATAGRNMVSTLISAINNALSSGSSSLYSSAKQIGSQIANGMVAGVNAGSTKVTNAAKNMAQKALNSAKSELGVHSPSREFMLIGDYITQGLALGITKTGERVNEAGRVLGSDVLSVFEDTLKTASNIMESDMTFSPVLTPVLDMSGINPDAFVFSSSLHTSASPYKGVVGGKEVEFANLEKAQREINVTFNQTNNSPKSLSRIDIYRQTNNQLSALKGALR